MNPATLPPVDRRPPEQLAELPAADQYAWFAHWHTHLRPAAEAYWNAYHVDSLTHRGLCCTSCQQDGDYTYPDDPCCCKTTQTGAPTP